jgi:hypothetical protein
MFAKQNFSLEAYLAPQPVPSAGQPAAASPAAKVEPAPSPAEADDQRAAGGKTVELGKITSRLSEGALN